MRVSVIESDCKELTSTVALFQLGLTLTHLQFFEPEQSKYGALGCFEIGNGWQMEYVKHVQQPTKDKQSKNVANHGCNML